jgi:hypothetical protein
MNVRNHGEHYETPRIVNQHDAQFILTFELPRLYMCVGGPGSRRLKKNKYHLPPIHFLPPDDGLQMGPKYVQAWQFNKVKINSAPCWFVM